MNLSVVASSSARVCVTSRPRPASTLAICGLSSRVPFTNAASRRTSTPSATRPQHQLLGRSTSHITHAQSEDQGNVNYNKEFGYSRKDVLLIGVGLIAFGYALYYGLQATGMEPGYAGNWVQLLVFMGICVFWVSTYVYRVATKQMTYVKQLEQYEEAVMRKRLDELTEEEMTELVRETEEDKNKGRGR